MTRLEKVYVWSVGLITLVLLVFMLEVSVGHDGLLCELGYDKDGHREGVSGCG